MYSALIGQGAGLSDVNESRDLRRHWGEGARDLWRHWGEEARDLWRHWREIQKKWFFFEKWLFLL